MKRAKKPWRSHYTKDWRTDPFVRDLPLDVRMVYLELLDIAWDEGGLRHEWLAEGTFLPRQIGCSRRKLEACWARVQVKFREFSPGIWSNDRLEIERVESEKHAENQRKRAEQRWDAHAVALQEPQSLSHTQSLHSHKEEEPRQLAGASQAPLQLESPKVDPPKLKKDEKPADPVRQDVIEVVNRFKTLWVERMRPDNGRPPRVLEADWVQVRKVVVEHGKDAALGFIDRYLDDPEPFLVENVHALRHLPGKVDKYRARAVTPLRTTQRLPTGDELRAANEAYNRKAAAKLRAENEAEGFRYVDKADGTYDVYDPQGRLLDGMGRPVVGEAIA